MTKWPPNDVAEGTRARRGDCRPGDAESHALNATVPHRLPARAIARQKGFNLNEMNLQDTQTGVGFQALQLYDKGTLAGKNAEGSWREARHLPVFFSQRRRFSCIPMFSEFMVRIPDLFPASKFEGWPLQIGSVYAR
jgi:hypothetical protein